MTYTHLFSMFLSRKSTISSAPVTNNEAYNVFKHGGTEHFPAYMVVPTETMHTAEATV